jgi:hypothetical protein
VAWVEIENEKQMATDMIKHAMGPRSLVASEKAVVDNQHDFQMRRREGRQLNTLDVECFFCGSSFKGLNKNCDASLGEDYRLLKP